MNKSKPIDFQTEPEKYRHWRVEYDGQVANLFMDVAEDGGLFENYKLKLNSYDLGVDIELADVVQRMRFEHPEIRVVVIQSAKDKVFCAGANIRMLAGAAHSHKVNFCKFTNETRNTYEMAEEESGQKYIAAIKGSCAGGGYEIALACNHIMLTDDGNSSVALPEVPLLAVLPGTGGLTRLTDKRRVRRDIADVFCSTEEGVRGKKAVEWRLVDEIVSNSKFEETVRERALDFASELETAEIGKGIPLGTLNRSFEGEDSISYDFVEVETDRTGRKATIIINGPKESAPADMNDYLEAGDQAYLLKLARELDDAILHLRFNEPELGLLVFKSQGDSELFDSHEQLLLTCRNHWFANEIICFWKRILKRIDYTSRSMIALIEHGSCFTGILAELIWAVDRSYMMEGDFEGDNRPVATVSLTESNFGVLPMGNGQTRLESRFNGNSDALEMARNRIGSHLQAEEAHQIEIVTFVLDDIDWEDEIRIFMEERASFSPDALTGMESNLRFTGPETMETRIFGRLSGFQNWIFSRPNAVGEEGALQRYGTGIRGEFDRKRT